jgi:hypothetical protein
MQNASAQGIEPRKEVTVSAASEEAYQLDLSPQAQKMLAPKDTAAAAAEAKPTRRPGVLSLPENQALVQSIKELEQKLNGFLLSRNIDNLANYQFEYHEDNTITLNNDIKDKKEIEAAVNGNSELVGEIRNVLAESQIAAANDLQHQYLDARGREGIKGNVEKTETLLQRTMSSQRILTNVGGYFSLNGGKLNITSITTAQNIILM